MSAVACASAKGFCLELGSTSLADWWPIAAALSEGLVQANVAAMRGGSMPALTELGVRFEPIVELAHGRWPIRLAPAVVRDRVGNCLDLAAYHAAYLRRLSGGGDALVRIVVPADGVEGHAVVFLPRARITIDPMRMCQS